MTGLYPLVKRNVRLYFSDRVAVFFSLLGALIAIFLILVFLRSSIVNSVTNSSDGLIDASLAGHLLHVWLIASASVIASATTGLGALREFVADRETARWRDFLVTPLPRWTIAGGYLLAATVVAILMTTVVYGLGTLFCWATGAPLSLGDTLEAWGWLMLSALGFTALMGFIVACLKTEAAYGGVSTIIGVTFGFLAGTYVTTGALPAGAANVLNSLPFAQASALVRQPYTRQVIAALPEQARDPLSAQMGIQLTVGASPVTTPVVVAVLVAMAVVFSVAAWQIMTRTVRR